MPLRRALHATVEAERAVTSTGSANGRRMGFERNRIRRRQNQPPRSRVETSVKLLRLQADVRLARAFLFLVLLDPRLPAFAGGRVAAGEGEAGNVGVANGQLSAAGFG